MSGTQKTKAQAKHRKWEPSACLTGDLFFELPFENLEMGEGAG